MPRKSFRAIQETNPVCSKIDYHVQWPNLLTEPFDKPLGKTWTKTCRALSTALSLSDTSVFVLLMMVDAHLQADDEIPAEALGRWPKAGISLPDFKKLKEGLIRQGLLSEPGKPRLRREKNSGLSALVPHPGLLNYLRCGRVEYLDLAQRNDKDSLLRNCLKCAEESDNPFDEPEDIQTLYNEIAQQQSSPLIHYLNNQQYNLREQVAVLLLIGHKLQHKDEVPLERLVRRIVQDPIDRLTFVTAWSNPEGSLLTKGLIEPAQSQGQRVTHVRLNPAPIQSLLPVHVWESLRPSIPVSPFLTIEPWSKIQEVEMIFPKDFDQEVQRLSQTLSESGLDRYFNRLKVARLSPTLMVMLSGLPGTGKTELCRQLARIHQRDLVVVNLSSIRSKWYGETEKHVDRLFASIRSAQAASERMPLVLFNEADSFFMSRGHVRSNVSNIENTLVTQFLENLERFEGLVFATTNYTESMDPAFERRWSFKLAVPSTDDQTRFRFLHKALGELVPESVLKRWSLHHQFTAAQLNNMYRKMLLLDGEDLSENRIEQILLQEINGWKSNSRPQIKGYSA